MKIGFDPQTIRWQGGPNTEGLRYTDVTDIIIPGRGRNEDGTGLNATTQVRTLYAAALFEHLGLVEQGGRLIASAGQTPSDTVGELWVAPDGVGFEHGVPEAWGMHQLLVKETGIPQHLMLVQPHSFTTATDLTHGQLTVYRTEDERRFWDTTVFGIVAQRQHADRIAQMAPHLMKRPYFIFEAPEADPTRPDVDPLMSRLVGRLTVAGIDPRKLGIEYLAELADKRSRRIWDGVLAVQGAANAVKQLSPWRAAAPVA